jgi:hypothetical protein
MDGLDCLPTQAHPPFFGNETGNETAIFGNETGNAIHKPLIHKKKRSTGNSPAACR